MTQLSVANGLRILLVDDNPDDRALVIRTLRQEFPRVEIEQVSDAEGLAAALERFDHDLCITDFQLLWTDGLRVLHRVRAKDPYRPVIMFTGTGSEEIAVAAMKAGLSDYVLKSPRHFARLSAAVHNALAQSAQAQTLREVQTALAERAQQYQDLVESIGAVVWEADAPDYRFSYVSPQAEAVFGYRLDEWLTQPDFMHAHIHPEDLPRVVAECDFALSERRNHTLEYRVFHASGAVMWVRNIVTVIDRNESPTRPPQLRGILLDVSERKRAEAALAASEQRFRRVVDSNMIGILFWDANGEISDANNEFLRIVGYNRADLASGRLRWRELTPPEHLPRDERALEEIRRTGVCTPFEKEYIAKDGRRVPILLGGASLNDDTPHRGVCFVLDITAQRASQAALAEYSQRLQVLSQRLLETQEAERRHIARELHDEIGQALTAIGIDLRGAQSAASPEVRAQLQEGIELVDRAIQQVRDLSLDLRPSLLDDLGLEAALRWYCDRGAQRAGLHLDVTSDIGGERLAPAVETACFRIVQEAFTNVLRHAQASRVKVSLVRMPSAIELSVADDGRGFDVAAARAAALGGTSFGLAGMEERARLLGGSLTIAASSAGTELRATVPLAPHAPMPQDIP